MIGGVDPRVKALHPDCHCDVTLRFGRISPVTTANAAQAVRDMQKKMRGRCPVATPKRAQTSPTTHPSIRPQRSPPALSLLAVSSSNPPNGLTI